LLVGFGALALTAVGCGSEGRENELRPPTPIEISARVDGKGVAIEPSAFGAGLATFTISNQSGEEVELTLQEVLSTTSPEDEPPSSTLSLPSVAPGSVGAGKLELTEGEYEVTAGPSSDAKPAVVVVGPERPSAQDELLLP
jgi:hypothetical protein